VVEWDDLMMRKDEMGMGRRCRIGRAVYLRPMVWLGLEEDCERWIPSICDRVSGRHLRLPRKRLDMQFNPHLAS
jgi:hypothetical protein